MELTDEEFEELHGAWHDRTYYGDDDIVYGDGERAIITRSIMAKLDIERARRKL